MVIQQADFDVAAEYTRLLEHSNSEGAVVFFVGSVRDSNQRRHVQGLYLEHYPAMTQKSIEYIVTQASQRWELGEVSVVHRVGQLSIGEQIVFVGVSAKHRHAAFEAAQFIMDKLKTRAPFWKKEYTDTGEYWVEARQSDQRACAKWDIQ